MKFVRSRIEGAWIVEAEPRSDERGFVSRIWDAQLFADQGLSAEFVQCNRSFNRRRGTLRGLHWQADPFGEAKFVGCARGAIFDVAVDVRPGSATFGQWVGVELTSVNGSWLYVPPGCAHGYLSLEDDTEALYAATRPHTPAAERGLRWNDPRFAIDWPDVGPLRISTKDQAWPDFGAT